MSGLNEINGAGPRHESDKDRPDPVRSIPSFAVMANKVQVASVAFIQNLGPRHEESEMAAAKRR